ncbi:threonine/serine exporter family protein [Thalassotalea sp. LPB0316]|uniref:threonine/serine ThrE exporter family protein n=1 Tax=Thalassotalea sp. LPB0316 TaxID=2769490 RepID=UPI0018661462|nr:threonine/serine exporter family protein [Thalassotalea sp. LPB0316]QOL25546.1 threonine/serine exporter family protein [Thalassotalea sp. LPB0316]
MPNAETFKQKRRFIIRLGKALHKFGTNSFRSEAHLQHVADFLELKAWFIITPTSLTFTFLDDDDQEHNFLVRVKPSELDLGSLARTDELVDELISGKRTLDEALERLEEIAEMPNPYGKLISFFAFGASSGAFAMLMHTSWNDVFWSTILGLIVALFIFWAERSKRVTEMLEPLSSLVCALAASAIASVDPKVNAPLVVLSAIIVFIPGLSLTLGLSELSARHLISGTARIMDAIMTLFKLYFGAFLGMALGSFVWQPLPFEASEPLNDWTAWLAVFILSSTLSVLFRLRGKDAPWAILGGFVAFGTSLWASTYLGLALGAFAGAFALGVYSNLFSRVMNLPSSIVLLLGLVVLVPGSKVFIGLNTAISGKEMLHVPDIGSQTFLIFMSLVAGLIFSNVAVRSRKSL